MLLWRNWHTRSPQTRFICEFDSHREHQIFIPNERILSCSCGGIGIRGRLKICFFTCGFNSHQEYHRGVAQFGSAAALGAEGRRFKSCYPDRALVMELGDIPR